MIHDVYVNYVNGSMFYCSLHCGYFFMLPVHELLKH